MKILIAIPVFNEERYLLKVLKEIRLHTNGDILVIDDGCLSTDTPTIVRFPRLRQNYVVTGHYSVIIHDWRVAIPTKPPLGLEPRT